MFKKQQVPSVMTITNDSDPEEVDNTWYPRDTLKATIDSLKVFKDFTVDDDKLTKSEVRESFKNFDSWLIDEIQRLYSQQKKEDDKELGDL